MGMLPQPLGLARMDLAGLQAGLILEPGCIAVGHPDHGGGKELELLPLRSHVGFEASTVASFIVKLIK